MKMLNQIRISRSPGKGASNVTSLFGSFRLGLLGAIIILLLWPSGETQAQIPTLPGWITDTLFIDYSAPVQGDGSFQNPMNSFHQQPLWGLPTWSSGSNLLIKSNTAFLFKNGVVHNISPRIRIDGDNNYFGSYGPGFKAVIQIGSGQLNTRGARQTVRDLELRGAVQDTTYLTVNWNFYGSGDYETSQPRTTTLDIDGLDITYGYRAIDIQRFRRVDIKNVHISNVWHDGMFMSACDSVFVDNFHLEKYNREWEFGANEYHNTGNSSLEPGGDGIQITGGTYSSIKYFVLENSIIDGSRYGGKFNFIAAGNTGTVIIRNSTFMMHPYKMAFHAAANFFVYNSTFIGPGGAGVHYNTKFYNCLFVGTDRNINIIDTGANRAGYAIRGNTRDIYNSVFANWYQAIGGVGANPNIRNTIFYNTTRALDLGYRKADASGIIHYNPEGNDYLGMQHYQSTNDYKMVNPQFVNPNVDFTWITSDNRQNVSGKYPHHYVVWNDFGDWRLQEGSPGVDAGDPNVYNPQATFVANVNQDGNSFTRNFTQYHQVADDIEGTPRPQGNGYDIGAYEFLAGSSTSYYSVDFNVRDQQNNPINNATITFNNQSNAPGNYSFGGISAGTYVYSVTAPNYQPLTVNNYNVNANATVTVNLQLNQFQVQLSPNPGQGGTVSGAGNYNHGQNATVSATPAQGYAFINWTENGNVVSTNATYTFTVSQNRILTANFSSNSYTISLNSNPSFGGTTTGAGNYNHGQNATVSATPAQGNTFTSWTENGNVVSTNATYSFSVTGNRALTAQFSKNSFEVSLVSSPTAGGTTMGAGAYLFESTATVSASPSEGYAFVNWTENGAVVSSNASFSFNITQNRLLTANFAPNMYVLIFLPGENGYLEGDNIQYVPYGESSKPVFANPNSGFHFARWCDSSVSNPKVEANVTTNITRTAFFDKNIYTLSYRAGNNGSIAGVQEQFVAHGSDGSMIEAVPYAGYKFANWSDGFKYNPRIDHGVEADLEVYANFEKEIIDDEIDDENEINVYPIPTKNILNVDISQTEEFEVFLIDNAGRFIGNFPNATQGSNQYNVSWLSPGVYFLNLVSPLRRITQKIIKSR